MPKAQPKTQPKRQPERVATRSGLPWQCPACGGSSARSRRSAHEYLYSVIGVMPRRCEGCSHRFYVHILTRPKADQKTGAKKSNPQDASS